MDISSIIPHKEERKCTTLPEYTEIPHEFLCILAFCSYLFRIALMMLITISTCKFVGFEVLTVVVMKSCVFKDITPCSQSKFSRGFGGTCRLHLQFRGISQARNQHEVNSKLGWLG
jgi:hypothetical protein